MLQLERSKRVHTQIVAQTRPTSNTTIQQNVKGNILLAKSLAYSSL